MVKIKGRTLEEEALSKKQSILERITKKFVTNGDVVIISDAIGIDNGKITILPRYNQIIVNTPEKLNSAINLASLYEKDYGEEFTVKKEYYEN